VGRSHGAGGHQASGWLICPTSLLEGPSRQMILADLPGRRKDPTGSKSRKDPTGSKSQEEDQAESLALRAVKVHDDATLVSARIDKPQSGHPKCHKPIHLRSRSQGPCATVDQCVWTGHLRAREPRKTAGSACDFRKQARWVVRPRSRS
jgi:hypothetical protein